VSDLQLIDESERNWTKAAALEEIDNLKSIRATAWDEHTHSFRWLMASLLAINGGACLALLNNSDVDLKFRIIASGIFIFGILMALLVAVFGQHSIQRTLGPLQKQIGYWMTVASDGERLAAYETELNDELLGSAKIGIASRVSGWLSAGAFLCGVITAGYGFAVAKSDTAVDQQNVETEVSRSNGK
jgi:hypothetical protein